MLSWIIIKRHIVLLLALTCGGGAIYAQLANTTSLVGTVTDSAGAAMPDVSITAVNTATLGRVTRRAAPRSSCWKSSAVGTFESLVPFLE